MSTVGELDAGGKPELEEVPAMVASARWTVVGLALAGAAIAAYLTLVQAGPVRHAWDPVFGIGSDDVLHSAFSRSLPFPDAALGLVAYLAEATLGVTGGGTRWERRPSLAVAFDLIGLGLAVAAVGLVVLQAFVVGAWCLLCLTSAAVSWTILAVGRLHEGRTAVRRLRSRRLSSAAGSCGSAPTGARPGRGTTSRTSARH